MNIYLDLFLTFLKVGAVSFGGGYGMISILQDEVLKHNWLTLEEFQDLIAVSESTPGPIAINMATFVGSTQGSILGSILATLGVVLPSFIIILIIIALLKNLLKYKGVDAFLKGVRPCVIGLIIATGLIMVINTLIGIKTIDSSFDFNWKNLVIFIIIASIALIYKKLRKKGISPILLILISAILGIALFSW